MGLETIALGAVIGKTAFDIFSPEEELPEVQQIQPLDLEEAPEIQIGVDEFEGLTQEEKSAKRRLRTDILQFNNTENNNIRDNIDTLNIGD